MSLWVEASRFSPRFTPSPEVGHVESIGFGAPRRRYDRRKRHRTDDGIHPRHRFVFLKSEFEKAYTDDGGGTCRRNMHGYFGKHSARDRIIPRRKII